MDQRETFLLAATVQNIDEYQTQVVSDLKLRSAGHGLELRWEGADPATEATRYFVQVDRRALPGQEIGFLGLLPVARQVGEMPIIGRLADAIRSA